MKILVTGATGHFGAKVMETLLETVPAENLAVSVRDTEKAGDLKVRGVDVRHGDFDQPETLDTAFKGVDRLLIVSTQGDNDTRIRQHLAAVEAAGRANVGYIAYTSLANIDKSTLSLAVVHRKTEEAIRNTGIPYAFLRNNWYVENETSAFQAVISGAPLAVSAGTGKVGWGARDDYAEAAARVLASNNDESVIYELCGKPINYGDLADILSKVIDRDIALQQLDDASYADMMKNVGLPQDIVDFVVDIQKAIRNGALDSESDDLEKLLGRAQTPLIDVVRCIVEGLQG